MNDPEDDGLCYEASARYAAMEAKNAIPEIKRQIASLQNEVKELQTKVANLVHPKGEPL